MENTMIRSLVLSAALLTTVLLMSAGSASARPGGTFVPSPGSAVQIKAVASAVNPFQILTIWASPIYTGGGEGNHDGYHDGNHDGYHDGDHNGNHDGDHNGNHDGHDNDGKAPTPEPSTILSFGAALLIGGGVLYSRRLRANKK
jgi:hypothetical protein